MSTDMLQAVSEPTAADMHPREAAELTRRSNSVKKTRGRSSSGGRASTTSAKSAGPVQRRRNGASILGAAAGVLKLFDDDDTEQEDRFTSPQRVTKLIRATTREATKDSNDYMQQFESLLLELLDGQRRLELQVGTIASLQPLVEEVKFDVKEMDKKLQCELQRPPHQRAPTSDVVASIDLPLAPVTDRKPPVSNSHDLPLAPLTVKQSLLSAGEEEILKDVSGTEVEDDGSLESGKAKRVSHSCTGYSLDVPEVPGKATIHVNVGGAELEQESKDEVVTSLCIVKLGERKLLETSSVCGHCPRWKHEESLPYFDEDALEFSVEVLGQTGVPSRCATSHLQLDDCRSPGGFSGRLKLEEMPRQLAEEMPRQLAEDKPEPTVLGQLEVSVWFEYNRERKESGLSQGRQSLPFAHLASSKSATSGLQPIQPKKNMSSVVHRLRHSMLAVAGTAAMHHGGHMHQTGSGRFSRRSASKLPPKGVWPTSIPIREGLNIGAADLEEEEEEGDTSVQSSHHQALTAMQSIIWRDKNFGVASWHVAQHADEGPNPQTSRTTIFRGRWALNRYILDPASKKILVYDLLSCAILLHDFVVIPYMLAWEVPLEGWFKISAWFSCVFWMWDICMSFLTGYVNDGQVEHRWWRVAKHYLRTWFLLDVSLVLLDAICVFGSELLVGKFTRILRMLRFARVVSLIRALRVTMNLEHVLDHRTSELSASMSYILKVFVVILWLGHVICCTWYWIGKHGASGTGLRWFDSIDNAAVVFSDLPTDYQYWTSFHWALSQISGNGVEIISPMNTGERIFNVACLVFGVIFGSALVSSLSATMIEVQMFKQEKLVKIRTVRQFLAQNDIPSKLAYRVQKQLKERIGKQKRISTMDVPELSLLSHKLRVELQFAIIGPYLLQHPLYNLCVDIDAHAVQGFCYETVEVIQTPAGEVIFNHSNDAENAFFVIRGELQYTQNPISAAHLKEKTQTNVGAGVWLSTAALWACWKHVGTMEASSAAELLTLNAKGMLSTMMQHPVLGTIFREYGRQFHNRLTKALPPYADWPSDLEVPFTSHAELVLAMSHELRTIVSVSALSKLRRQRAWHPRGMKQGLDMLEEEVKIGKCTVMLTETGVVERVVAVAVLHLQCADGRVLVQVGKLADDTIQACCRLPGKHHHESEMPYEAVQRLIAIDLEPFKDGIHMDTSRCPEQADESKDSPTFGICTHYLRTALFAFLDGSFPMVPEGSRLIPTSDSAGRAMEKNFNVSESIESAPPQPRFALDPGAVFAATGGRHTNIYAWISLDDFTAHQSHLADIQLWLDDYKVPDSFMQREDKETHPDRGQRSTAFEEAASTATHAAVHPYAIVPTPSTCSESNSLL